jgi:ribosome-binding protein aMBF1 (putative translation factor)
VITHEFKVALQKARVAKGLSQKDLAQQLNVK